MGQSVLQSVIEDDSSKSSSKNSGDLNCGSSHSASGTSTTGNIDDDEESIKNQLTRRETIAVFRLRVLVILILVAAAASVSLTVFFITKNAEKEEFQTQYYGIANKIIQSFQDVMVQMSAVSGLAVAESAEGGDGNWPFVTINHFQERAGNARTLSGALFVSVNPIVDYETLIEWEEYVVGNNNQWIDDGLKFQEEQGINDFQDPFNIDQSWLTLGKVDPLHTYDDKGQPMLSISSGPYLPRWQSNPVLKSSVVNENLFEKEAIAPVSKDCIDTKSAVLGGFITAPAGPTSHPNPDTSFFATLRSMWEGEQVEYLGDPMSYLTVPVFSSLDGTDRDVVAVLGSFIHWRSYLRNILPDTVQGIAVVIENECDGFFTYEIHGSNANVIGFGDQHDMNFHDYEVEGSFTTEWLEDGTIEGLQLNQEGCPYRFHVYPTQQFYDDFITGDPVNICLYVAVVFLFTICMFMAYDRLVERRQRLILAKATQSTAIVSSLFPKQVRDRLLANENVKSKSVAKGSSMVGQNHRLKSFLSGAADHDTNDDKPIADLFPDCTVYFADIAGFTAWSSTREPSQVFVLLQAVYQAFDRLAKHRRVFKVETIGDAYVAVTGLPEPQPNHAVIMARFAVDCLIKVGEITKELEVQLGPDTGELSMRFGLHSGPVTAGVLKGDRARFQLFGDTVNTAARMESTGVKGKIQISQSTARILIDAGKKAWVLPRKDAVDAKGKGVLNTFWLASGTAGQGDSEKTPEHDAESPKKRPIVLTRLIESETTEANMKQARLVDWMVDLLFARIKKIVVVRERCGHKRKEDGNIFFEPPEGKICLDEVKEVINMPHFDISVAHAEEDWENVEVPSYITEQLREYVTLIANSYRANPFHNFEHACHVTMSVNKLLSRIVAPDLAPVDNEKLKKGRDEVAARIHDHTYGITSDPMAVFAITFSALIHDVDHQGIGNPQLAKEEPEMSKLYRNKSLAEQNSLDVAWDELMSSRFETLRKYIFGTQAELIHFRQLVVNIVLATDIFDKELNDLRKSRWERAFQGDGTMKHSLVNDYRATIVMEHIIQASDVSHSMQHWHVYRKWNAQLFSEMCHAYDNGRMGADPRKFWYTGELGFFDNYIIPLAKKLKECNVFGVSSDEYLNYAVMNRAEWEERGKEILEDMIASLEIPAVAEENSGSLPETASASDGSSSIGSSGQLVDA